MRVGNNSLQDPHPVITLYHTRLTEQSRAFISNTTILNFSLLQSLAPSLLCCSSTFFNTLHACFLLPLPLHHSPPFPPSLTCSLIALTHSLTRSLTHTHTLTHFLTHSLPD